MTDGYLSLTERDRDEMLAAIGVSSIDDLFEQIPEGVRFDRELDVPPALTEVELIRHLEELAAKNCSHGRRALVPRRRDLRPSHARDRGHDPAARRVPDRVHAVPARDEPGRAAGDLRVPDGDLRAHRAWTCRTRPATTGSRSRPTPVTSRSMQPGARASCSPRRSTRRCARSSRPMRRGSASRSSRCRTRVASPIPTRIAAAAVDAAAVIFPQPNFFGCLEDAPALAAAARDAGALAVAHVDLTSLGVLEAPGRVRLRHGDRRRASRSATRRATAARTTASSPRVPSSSAGCRAGSSVRRPTSTASAASC